MKTFSIRESFNFGWQMLQEHFGLLLGLALISMLLSGGGSFVSNTLQMNKHVDMSLGVNIISSVLGLIVSIGALKIYLQLIDKQKTGLDELFNINGSEFIRYFFAGFIVGLLSFVGLIFLIIPGVIISLRLQFAPTLTIDKGLSPFDAISASWKMTSGLTGKLFVFGLAQAGLSILGLFALIIGLLAVLPVISMAQLFVYRKLVHGLGMHHSNSKDNEKDKDKALEAAKA